MTSVNLVWLALDCFLRRRGIRILIVPGIRLKLDLVAGEISKKIAGEDSGTSTLGTTVDYLFGDLGYQGNAQDYYDPRNSFINEVIERRIGIPISFVGSFYRSR